MHSSEKNQRVNPRQIFWVYAPKKVEDINMFLDFP